MRPRPTRFPWKALLRGALAAALVILLLVRIDFNEFAQAFATLSVWLLVAAFLFRAAAVVLRSIRWQRLGVTHQHATTLDCLSATANGLLIGSAVPGLGEFTRAYILKRRARVPFGSVLSILVAERVLDTFLLLVLIFVVLVLVPVTRWLTVAATLIAGGLVVGILLLVLLVATRHTSVRRLEQVLSCVSPRVARHVSGFFESFALGLRRLGELRVRKVLSIVALSVVFWLSHGCFIYLVFCSFGSRLALGFHVALLTAAVLYFGMIIHITPAGLGQYEIVVVALLVAFGVDKSLAFSVSLALHGVRLLVTVTLGLPFLYREHLGISKLVKEKEAAGRETASFSTGAAE